MGSFDTACSLTGTVLHSGSPCYLVVMESDFTMKDGYRPDIGSVKTVIQGVYDDYGTLKPTAEYTTEALMEMTNILDGPMHFFVCAEAWDWCQAKFADYCPGDLDTSYNENFLAETVAKGTDAGLVSYLEYELARKKARKEKLLPVARVFVGFLLANRNVMSGYGVRAQMHGRRDIMQIIEMTEMSLRLLKEEKKRLDAEWGYDENDPT